jgi:WD40 repeat protein
MWFYKITLGLADETIRVWDTTTGSEVLGALRDPEGRVDCVAPDGQRLLSSASDNAIYGWDLSTGMIILVLQGQ